MTLRHPVHALLAISAVAALALPLASCGSGSDSRSSAADKGSPTSVVVPTMKAKEGTQLEQAKGETTVVLAAEPCKLKVTQDKSEKSASGIGSEVGGKYRYTVTTVDKAEFDPDRFQLLISLKNNGKAAMDYSQGMQFEYLIDGKPAEHSVDTKGVAMTNVPSGGTAFYQINGPAIESLKPGQNIVVTLHNCPVKPGKGADSKTDVTWNLVVAAEKTVELKTTTATEWR